jgi:hypothetical protein
MASTMLQFLAMFAHPVYPQRSAIINALTLSVAQSIARDQVSGSRWTVASVAPFSPPTL